MFKNYNNDEHRLNFRKLSALKNRHKMQINSKIWDLNDYEFNVLKALRLIALTKIAL